MSRVEDDEIERKHLALQAMNDRVSELIGKLEDASVHMKKLDRKLDALLVKAQKLNDLAR